MKNEPEIITYVMFGDHSEDIFENYEQQNQNTEKWSQPASQPIAKPERMCWLKPEHREIKQSKTRTHWHQTIQNQNTVKSNNPKPEHSEIKQSQTNTQWNQTISRQNTMKSNS